MLLETENETIEVIGTKTVRNLLAYLNIKQGTALVIRDKELLTADLAIKHRDFITIRKVTSSG